MCCSVLIVCNEKICEKVDPPNYAIISVLKLEDRRGIHSRTRCFIKHSNNNNYNDNIILALKCCMTRRERKIKIYNMLSIFIQLRMVQR